MSKKTLSSVSFAVGTLMTVGLSDVASADANPFILQQLDSGYMQLAAHHEGEHDAKEGTEGKCGAGKCGGEKGTEGKCGADRPGADE